jgi:hypothetical protein
LAAAVVQLGGSVFIWHMTELFSTAYCLYAARLKSERPLLVLGFKFHLDLGFGLEVLHRGAVFMM